jgi:hypothetical protein
MVIMPVAENISYVADAVRLAVAYRLITQEVFTAIDDNAVLVVIVDDLAIPSAVGVGLLRHGWNPDSNLAHSLSPSLFASMRALMSAMSLSLR